MSEHIPYESRILSEDDKKAILIGLEQITKEREELKDKDPHEVVLGITSDGALLSVDEHYKADPFKGAYFVVRHAPLSELASGQPFVRQEMTYGEVTRSRDGGTTIMPTQFGEIYSPAPSHAEPTTLDSVPITPLPVDLLPNPEV